MTKTYEDYNNHRKCSLSLLLHTHIPDTSAESLLQINLYFKPAVEWNMNKAQSSARAISGISDMPSTEFVQLLFTKNIFFFFPDNKTGAGTKHSPEKDGAFTAPATAWV
jgi:hypothetical protein